MRVDRPRPLGAPLRANVGTGAGAVAYGHDAVWVADAARRPRARLDPVIGSSQAAGRASARCPASSPSPASGVWVSLTGPAVAGGPQRAAPLGTRRGRGASDVVLRRGAAAPSGQPLADRGRWRARSRRSRAARLPRAGAHAIGYRLVRRLDRSGRRRGTPPSAWANARAYAADPASCSSSAPTTRSARGVRCRSPPSAPRGPLAMLSASNTFAAADPRRAPGGGAYARIIARDDAQGPERWPRSCARAGTQSVYVLEDAEGRTSGWTGVTSRAAARAEGLRDRGARLVGDRERKPRRLGAPRRRGAGRGLRRRGSSTPGRRGDARAAPRCRRDDVGGPRPAAAGRRGSSRTRGDAQGVLLTSTLPRQALPAVGRRLAADLARGRGRRAHRPRVRGPGRRGRARRDRSLGRLAASVAPRRSLPRTCATPRWDASLRRPRRSARGPVAVLGARRPGGSRDLLSTDGADVVAIRSPR